MNKSKQKKIAPIHPGEILKEELEFLGVSQTKLATSINVSTRRVNEICLGKRGISNDTALRLGIYFGMGDQGAEFWINLQQKYERECLKDAMISQGKEIGSQIHPYSKDSLTI